MSEFVRASRLYDAHTRESRNLDWPHLDDTAEGDR